MLQLTLQGFLKMCDDILGELAGIDIKPLEKVPAYLQVCAVRHALSAIA